MNNNSDVTLKKRRLKARLLSVLSSFYAVSKKKKIPSNIICLVSKNYFLRFS